MLPETSFLLSLIPWLLCLLGLEGCQLFWFHLTINLTLYYASIALCFYHILLSPFVGFFDFSAKLWPPPAWNVSYLTFFPSTGDIVWPGFISSNIYWVLPVLTKLGQFPSCDAKWKKAWVTPWWPKYISTILWSHPVLCRRIALYGLI